LDGHVRAFAHFGGVPARVRYDNLKPAVVRLMKGSASSSDHCTVAAAYSAVGLW
jgi:transposase